MSDLPARRRLRQALTRYIGWMLAMVALLMVPLSGSVGFGLLPTWARFVWSSDDASHTLLILPITFYLAYLRWGWLPAPAPAKVMGLLLAMLGGVGVVVGLGSAAFEAVEIVDVRGMAERLQRRSDPVGQYLVGRFSDASRESLNKYLGGRLGHSDMRDVLVGELNEVVGGALIYEGVRFDEVTLRQSTVDLREEGLRGENLAWLNRKLLEDAFPAELRRHEGLLGHEQPLRLGLRCTAITLALGDNGRPVVVGVVLFMWLLAGAWWCFGAPVIRALMFPALFLVFLIPIPDVILERVNEFLQYWTAEASYWMLRMIEQDVFIGGANKLVVGSLTLQVVESCSGFRSSMVLLIVALLGGHLMLRTNWRRAVLVISSVPIGIVRNGLRVVILAELALRFGIPVESRDNLFHTQGGQLMFVVSLIPLFVLLLWLRKTEARPTSSPTPTVGGDR